MSETKNRDGQQQSLCPVCTRFRLQALERRAVARKRWRLRCASLKTEIMPFERNPVETVDGG